MHDSTYKKFKNCNINYFDSHQNIGYPCEPVGILLIKKMSKGTLCGAVNVIYFNVGDS